MRCLQFDFLILKRVFEGLAHIDKFLGVFVTLAHFLETRFFVEVFLSDAA